MWERSIRGLSSVPECHQSMTSPWLMIGHWAQYCTNTNTNTNTKTNTNTGTNSNTETNTIFENGTNSNEVWNLDISTAQGTMLQSVIVVPQ